VNKSSLREFSSKFGLNNTISKSVFPNLMHTFFITWICFRFWICKTAFLSLAGLYGRLHITGVGGGGASTPSPGLPASHHPSPNGIHAGSPGTAVPFLFVEPFSGLPSSHHLLPTGILTGSLGMAVLFLSVECSGSRATLFTLSFAHWNPYW